MAYLKTLIYCIVGLTSSSAAIIVILFLVFFTFPDSPKLQSVLHVNVSQLQVDECLHTDCKKSRGCSTQLSIGDSSTLLDSGPFSLVSVRVTSSAVCGCSAREMTHQPCSFYATNPCLNGGTCIDTQNGYR